jgi:polyhydroxyalkanoate synthesis repressor PhaR
MAPGPISIKRYPNRRYYASHKSKYVSLREIEEMVQSGQTVQIRDSQSGDDITQSVLTQIIMERHPEKMSLFPTDMLHFILRSNDVMSGLLGDYFRHSLAYLDYLKRHNPAAAVVDPRHWVKAWLESVSSASAGDAERTPSPESAQLAQRVKQLEERLEQMESGKQQTPPQ